MGALVTKVSLYEIRKWELVSQRCEGVLGYEMPVRVVLCGGNVVRGSMEGAWIPDDLRLATGEARRWRPARGGHGVEWKGMLHELVNSIMSVSWHVSYVGLGLSLEVLRFVGLWLARYMGVSFWVGCSVLNMLELSFKRRGGLGFANVECVVVININLDLVPELVSRFRGCKVFLVDSFCSGVLGVDIGGRFDWGVLAAYKTVLFLVGVGEGFDGVFSWGFYHMFLRFNLVKGVSWSVELIYPNGEGVGSGCSGGVVLYNYGELGSSRKRVEQNINGIHWGDAARFGGFTQHLRVLGENEDWRVRRCFFGSFESLLGAEGWFFYYFPGLSDLERRGHFLLRDGSVVYREQVLGSELVFQEEAMLRYIDDAILPPLNVFDGILVGEGVCGAGELVQWCRLRLSVGSLSLWEPRFGLMRGFDSVGWNVNRAGSGVVLSYYLLNVMRRIWKGL